LGHLKKTKLQNKIYIKNLNGTGKINGEKNYINFLNKKFKYLKFENNKKNFLSVFNNYNFFIHVYFGTVFFECMALNKPQIIIYDRTTHPEFDTAFKNYIKEFEKINILFKSAYEASKFLQKNYFTIDIWWNSFKIQRLRKEFCRDYCLFVKDDIKIIKKIFK
jgi:putative transferase (TIGR04331 family)